MFRLNSSRKTTIRPKVRTTSCSRPITAPKPRADLKPNTADFERLPLVKPTGFREYDARWLFPQEINLMGLNTIGLRAPLGIFLQRPRFP